MMEKVPIIFHIKQCSSVQPSISPSCSTAASAAERLLPNLGAAPAVARAARREDLLIQEWERGSNPGRGVY